MTDPVYSGQPLSALGFPPADSIFDVASFRLSVTDDAHPWVLDNAADIAANWNREVAANPHLFNGTMVFQRTLSFADGHVEGRAHFVPYASFLHWRRQGRAGGGYHLFAMPIILSSDGALMAARMAETTSNPGRVYSPAGVLDPNDIRDGLCDIDGNVRREALEETGLDLATMRAEAGYRAVHTGHTLALFRVFRSPLDERALQAAARAHIASETEPEISDLVGIRSADPTAHDYANFMLPVLDWLFGADRALRGPTV